MAMDPNDVRQSGAGKLLGHVMEAEIVESSTLADSFQALQGGLDFLLAATVLVIGVHNPVLLLPVIAFAAIVVVLVLQYHRQRQAWTDTRLRMTGDLIEKLAGHRTRQVQEPKERWGDGKDHSLHHYLAVSQRLDSKSITLRILIPQCWLIVGFAALTPSFLINPVGPLIDRMPASLFQTVCETGWQLSHGENAGYMSRERYCNNPICSCLMKASPRSIQKHLS